MSNFFNRIEDEYNKFREKIMSLSKNEIYHSAHKIRFYESIYYYLERISEENDDEQISEIEEIFNGRSLKELYEVYSFSDRSYNIENPEDIDLFIFDLD